MPYIGKQPANVPVTADDIPNDSITTAKIVDAAITIADIGPNAVGSSEMADDAGNEGVVVSELERGTPASRIGLQPDDVIIGVNRIRTSSVADFRNALDESKGVIALNVKRGSASLYLVIR